MHRAKTLFLILLLLTDARSYLFAQVAQTDGSGRVVGTVKDANTGETLPGAYVLLQSSSSIGTATDLNGEFVLARVPAGRVVLVARYVGYSSVEQEVVVVRGQTLTVHFTMTPESYTGQEVLVTAQAQGQQQAINIQINSDKIVNVVSEARIQEMPDFNAAAALSRLPGISTLKSSGEDNKIVIRGLAPEFNSIEIEGIRMSATGSTQIGLSANRDIGNSALNNDRSVDLTMVSPYMIRMISVYKSLTPDMNANSIGGTVNMELREAPDRVHWDALWQQGYTAKSNTYGNYRGVLSGSNRFLNNKFGIYLLGNMEAYDRNADNLNANYGVFSSVIDTTTGFRPVQVNSVTFNRHVETRRRYGGNLILDYKLPSGSIKLINMFARLNSASVDHNQNMNYINGMMRWDVRQNDNILDQQMNSLRVNYDFGFLLANMSVSYTSARNNMDRSPHVSLNQTAALQGGQPRVNMRPEEVVGFQTYRGEEHVILRSANLFSSFYKEEKVTYKTDFEIPFTLNRWASGFIKVGGQHDRQYNSVDQAAPYVEFTSGEPTSISGRMRQGIADEFGMTWNPQGFFNGTWFAVGEDHRLRNPFLGNQYGNMYYATRHKRLFDVLRFVRANPAYHASNPDASTGAVGGWYDGVYQQYANDYEYWETYLATYAMARLNIGGLMVIGGARYERVDSDYLAYNSMEPRSAQIPFESVMFPAKSKGHNAYVLPMAQMKLSPVSWMDLRYAYTQTLSRPSYSQLTPKFNITLTQDIFAGNPDLKPATAVSHDANITFHANMLGLLSFGAFHKSIDNFVYTSRYNLRAAEAYGMDHRSNYTVEKDGIVVIRPSQSGTGVLDGSITVQRPVNNPNSAIVKGLEVDFQTNFWYLPQPLNGLVLGVNYARIFSETTYMFYSTTRIPGSRPPRDTLVIGSRKARLLFQPNHTLNTFLGYDYKGFSSRVSATFQANSVTRIDAQYPDGDYFTRDYLRVDFSARQKLPYLKSELFLDVSNLNGVNNESAQRSTGGFSNVQNYGLTANFGIRIRN